MKSASFALSGSLPPYPYTGNSSPLNWEEYPNTSDNRTINFERTSDSDWISDNLNSSMTDWIAALSYD